MSDRLIDISVHIKRPLKEVFAAWTSAEEFASWFAPMATRKPDVEMEFVVGGRYAIVMPLPDGSVHTTAGVYQEIIPNESIVMTWHCDAFEDPESLVEVRFTASDSGTDIHLIHKTFDSDETCDAHRGGWETCLGGLGEYLNKSNGA